MKYTITVEDVTAAELVKISQMLAGEITVQPNAAIIPINKEDSALVDTYNKLASPEHAKIDLTTSELDASGLPWNEQIHSGTKTKTAKGLWTRRRGVDENTFNTIESHLRAATVPAIPAVPDPSTMFNLAPAAPVNIPAAPAFLPSAPVVNATAPATVPATSVASAEIPAPPTVNFTTLTARITNGFVLGKIDASYPPSVCTRVGAAFGKQIASLTDIMNDQAMIEYADKIVTSDNAGF